MYLYGCQVSLFKIGVDSQLDFLLYLRYFYTVLEETADWATQAWVCLIFLFIIPQNVPLANLA